VRQFISLQELTTNYIGLISVILLTQSKTYMFQKEKALFLTGLLSCFCLICNIIYVWRVPMKMWREISVQEHSLYLRYSPFWNVTERRLMVTDVSGQPICPVFKGQAFQKVV